MTIRLAPEDSVHPIDPAAAGGGASRYTDRWWAEIADLRAAIAELDFVRSLADGSLARAEFEHYVAQDALYLATYAEVLSRAADLAESPAEREFWAESARACREVELVKHEERLAGAGGAGAGGSRGAGASDVDSEDGTGVSGAEPRASVTTTAYLAHLVAAADSGSYPALIAALLPCFWLYSDLGRELRPYATATNSYAEWIVTYSDPQFEASTETARLIVDAVAEGADEATRAAMAQAFRISAEHELVFFAQSGAVQTVALLERLRRDAPLVQCLTNSVVTNFTANVLLAIGASAAMVDLPGEASLFAGITGGVLINLGTPHAEQRAAMLEAATAAHESGTPWVLDPVAIGMLPIRTELAQRLVALRPTVIRGNPSEIIALAGLGSGGRGVDSTASGDEALAAALSLATQFGSVVAVSGAVDIVTDGKRIARLANGDPLLTQVTGGGCALGAVMAAFLGAARHPATDPEAVEASPEQHPVQTSPEREAGGRPVPGETLARQTATARRDPFAATIAAVTAYTIAAELAADVSAGPGSFAVAFVDALANVDGASILTRFRRG